MSVRHRMLRIKKFGVATYSITRDIAPLRRAQNMRDIGHFLAFARGRSVDPDARNFGLIRADVSTRSMDYKFVCKRDTILNSDVRRAPIRSMPPPSETNPKSGATVRPKREILRIPGGAHRRRPYYKSTRCDAE